MFKGKIFYYDDIMYILFDEEMEKLNGNSIFLGQNYSFGIDKKNYISLRNILKEVFLCSLSENYVSFRVKEDSKEVLKNYKLRFGEVALKEVRYVTNKKGEVYDLCNLYDIRFNGELISLRDFKINFINEWSINLLLKGDIFIKSLKAEDFTFEANRKGVEIDCIKKNKSNDFTVVFKEPCTKSASEKLVLKTKEIIKGSIDSLGRFIKENDSVEIENKLNPKIRNISLLEILNGNITLALRFDIDILRYSCNDFYTRINNEKALIKGTSNFLKKGEDLILKIENVSGIDINDVDIYVKSEEIQTFFTFGYNKKEIERFSFVRVEALYAKKASFKSEIDSILSIEFNHILKKIDKLSVIYKISKEIGKIKFTDEEYSQVTFYYEEDTPSISEKEVEMKVQSFGNTLNILWEKSVLEKIQGFIHVDYMNGDYIENENGARGLKGYTTLIEYEENIEEIVYSEASNFGKGWTLEGKTITKPAVIEIDNSVSNRYYGSLFNKTIFKAELKLIYIEKNAGSLHVEVDIYNFKCDNLVIDIDKNININFKECNVKNIIKL